MKERNIIHSYVIVGNLIRNVNVQIEYMHVYT